VAEIIEYSSFDELSRKFGISAIPLGIYPPEIISIIAVDNF
jgi:hypothetical protein